MKKYAAFFTIVLTACLHGTAQLEILQEIEMLHKNIAYKKARPLFDKIDTLLLNDIQQSRYNYELARSYINIEGEMIDSYQLLLKAKKMIQNENLNLLFKINDELYYSQYAQVQLEDTATELVDENCTIANETGDPKQLIACNSYKFRQIADDDQQAYEKRIDLLHDSRMIATRAQLETIKGKILMNIAATHDNGERYDSAIVYYTKIKPIIEDKKNLPATTILYTNLGYTYHNLGRYPEAIAALKEALQLSEKQDLKPNKSKILMNLATAYAANKNFEESSKMYKKVIDRANADRESERFTQIQELEAKYQAQERKLENAELSAANERQKVMIISIASSMLVLLLGGLFVYKNQDKKRRIALQEKELEKQRANNLMKNQELATIDAMISGQEKERKKLASELHDDLGSSLTTIRLYFENLKKHFKEDTSIEIYQRTDKLLEDTYKTIRGMSHTRHHGVMASAGLIPSMKTLGDNLTNSGKIEVNILHHNMDRKLETSLELNIFRILQELLSNVVKHAQATTVTINIIGTDDSINLMVEDNGKGFISKKNKKKDGMGLYSIETRVEEMDGTFEVDSNLGHGTTISIEIPTL